MGWQSGSERYCMTSVDCKLQEFSVMLLQGLLHCKSNHASTALCRNVKSAQVQVKAALVPPQASEAAGLASAKVPIEGPTQSVGALSRLNRMLEYSAWAIIVSCTVVALSEDGFGYFRFRVLPGALRDSLRSLMQQQAVQVEELMAKYDPPPENSNMSDSIVLGPWGASSSYIQVPQGPTVSMEY